MKFLIAAILALLVLLCSCQAADEQPEASPTASPSPATGDEIITSPPESNEPIIPVDITYYANTIELSSRIKLAVEASYPKTGIADIDDFYSDCLEDFVSYSQGLASDFNDDIPDTAVSQYDLHDSFEVVRNAGGIFSVHRTVYQYSGGAHGSHTDVCDNFTFDGKRLTLGDLFDAPQEEYFEDILTVFERFIASESEKPDGYRLFDNALLWLRDEFPQSSFCIGDDGLLFFISPYYISAYVEGTIVIPVAWEDLSAVRQEFIST